MSYTRQEVTVNATSILNLTQCPTCKNYWPTCTCIVTTTTTGTDGIWMSPDFHKPMKLVDDDPPPGVMSDIPAMRERAESVKARPTHKDLDGETARLLASDILALCEALEEAYS